LATVGQVGKRCISGGRTVTRVVRSALVVLTTVLALTATGCGSSRPPGVAVEPGDCYCELTDLAAERQNGELRLHVHYRFPDTFPDANAWFVFVFEVNGGSGGVMKVTKQGREMEDEGDIVYTTNADFARQKSGTFAAQLRQSRSKTGPFHDVSGKLIFEF
jgi:hypothetical protein